jgi:hypothetical protein
MALRSLTCLISFLLLMIGCNQPNRTPNPKANSSTIKFILPTGFVGVFKIVENKDNGISPVISNGGVIYHIPSSGILITKDASYLKNWHKIEAVYTNGNTIDTSFASGAEGTMKFYDLFSDANGGIYYLIGTSEEKAIAWQKSENIDKFIGKTLLNKN